MRYVYPAIFHPFDDGSAGYMVTFPDIPGCLTEGFSLAEALQMAHSALQEMMAYYEDEGLKPKNPPSEIRNLKIEWDKGQFPTLISVETTGKKQCSEDGRHPKMDGGQSSRKTHQPFHDIAERLGREAQRIT